MPSCAREEWFGGSSQRRRRVVGFYGVSHSLSINVLTVFRLVVVLDRRRIRRNEEYYTSKALAAR